MQNTYWNHKGKLQDLAKELEKLIPIEGSVPNPRKNRQLEKFRKAANCYYDLYNNGLCNRASEFNRVFGFSAIRHSYRGRYGRRFSQTAYSLTEQMMDEIIENAAREQNLLK